MWGCAESNGARHGCPDTAYGASLFGDVGCAVHARTIRSAEAQRHIAFNAGGEAGARFARALAMPVSGGTLPRLIRASPLPEVPTSRAVGSDDWAWHPGRRYGAIIGDLARNRPFDQSPDRAARTVEAWLKRHPGIGVVARDRASAYADGVRGGAPEATQVADRWHLPRNLGDASAGALDRYHRALRAAAATVHGEVPKARTVPVASPRSVAEAEEPDRHAVRRARSTEALALRGQGWAGRCGASLVP